MLPVQSANGWTIVAVHDSKESWERFRDGVLMPRMAQGIEGGFAAPPAETTFDVHKLTPSGSRDAVSEAALGDPTGA